MYLILTYFPNILFGVMIINKLVWSNFTIKILKFNQTEVLVNL